MVCDQTMGYVGKTEILEGFVYESKAFGSYFTDIEELAQGQNLLNCRRV